MNIESLTQCNTTNSQQSDGWY